MCKMFAIPCPNRTRGGGGAPTMAGGPESRPIFQVFMFKYVCSMLVGVTSSVWLYSSKTVVSWRLFIERLQGNGGNGGAGGAAALGNVVVTGQHRNRGAGQAYV